MFERLKQSLVATVDSNTEDSIISSRPHQLGFPSPLCLRSRSDKISCSNEFAVCACVLLKTPEYHVIDATPLHIVIAGDMVNSLQHTCYSRPRQQQICGSGQVTGADGCWL